MKQQFSLQPIRDIAQRKSDDAASSLGQLRGQEQQSRQTLETLENYRDEYRSRFEQALMTGMTPAELNNYQAFLAKLDLAVEEQRRLVSQSESRSEEGLQHWQTQTRKLKSLDVLAEREDEKHRKHEQRLEQRLLDDHNSTRAGKHKP
jgi:flagellar FliJ protein